MINLLDLQWLKEGASLLKLRLRAQRCSSTEVTTNLPSPGSWILDPFCKFGRLRYLDSKIVVLRCTVSPN